MGRGIPSENHRSGKLISKAFDMIYEKSL